MVDRAMADLPAELTDKLDNVEIAIEDVPPESHGDEVLLGLYEGVPLPERGWGQPLMPDRIRLFRGPLQVRARDPQELRDLVASTVVHEVAHHFGIDDDRLDELGWG
ncbi:metallopeptidase family protein [Salsipaludibacter albus]|uniref:metallopeptidase family protein n=1 Tax=Salsipaludibacter albus TaxID=2849650 RepID=UPI001EE4B304|nr:metallopeptidase family protein [Salsipaludibacter albus]MBY5163853.1 metallopeptidase family protein [Salsipaludibacter albus]